MKSITIMLFGVCFTVFASAAEFNDQQTEIWGFITNSWSDDVGETGAWPDSYVHDKVLAWDALWPIPRGKESIAKWTRYRDVNTEVQEYELFPMAIVVEGDTAVAHYSVVLVRKNDEGKNVRTVIGAIETLHRDAESWRYITLSSFTIGSDDD